MRRRHRDGEVLEGPTELLASDPSVVRSRVAVVRGEDDFALLWVSGYRQRPGGYLSFARGPLACPR